MLNLRDGRRLGTTSLPRPPIGRLLAAALLALTAGCVNPSLDAVAGVDCLTAADCPAERACVDGRCGACGPEACDGFDNDCDGRVDEDFDLQSSAEHCGACGAACAGECLDGVCAVRDAEVDAAPCVPDGDERCNDVDDDCDGRIDEQVRNVCGACGPVPDEACNGEDDDCDGQTDEGLLNACGACGEAPAEACNGEDDDCDGQTDEGLLNACGDCGEAPVEICNGADDDCDGEADEGLLNACGGCGEVPVEGCNGVDDDCDGATDEDFPGVGEPCSDGVGACRREAVATCTDAGDAVECSAQAAPPAADEICGNDLDDDCDGTTDEGFPGLGEPCSVGVGACRVSGTFVCDAANPDAVVCDREPLAATVEVCDLLDNDCDGSADEDFDVQSDPANCGGCAALDPVFACALDNAVAACERGLCTIASCQSGFSNDDGDIDNGCECNRAAIDLPDPDFVDANCDGVDGDVTRTVFVAAQGGDDGNDGSLNAPVASLGAAVAIATSIRQRSAVLLAEGTYTVDATLAVDVALTLHGGYRYDGGAPEGQRWTRGPHADHPTVIRAADGVVPTIQLEGAGAALLIDNLVVAGGASPDPVTLKANQCASLDLRDAELRTPDAASGDDGAAAPRTPLTATEGQPGEDIGNPGQGGFNPACPDGTTGGIGGTGGNQIAEPSAGMNGVGPAGGEGGRPANRLGAAVEGGPAQAPGTTGAQCVQPVEVVRVDPASLALLSSLPAPAGAGGPGSGGGGGGGSYTAALAVFDVAGGGGGGGGGCGGGPGGNGTPGGAAIGLIVVGPCPVTLTRSVVVVGRGGDGGDGGQGALGERGALGGLPGDGGDQPAAAGGRGGQGGCGGDGCGGNGGHAIGLVTLGDVAVQVDGDSRFAVGAAGQAGAAPAPVVDCEHPAAADDGAPGRQAERLCCDADGRCSFDGCPAP